MRDPDPAIFRLKLDDQFHVRHVFDGLKKLTRLIIMNSLEKVAECPRKRWWKARNPKTTPLGEEWNIPTAWNVFLRQAVELQPINWVHATQSRCFCRVRGPGTATMKAKIGQQQGCWSPWGDRWKMLWNFLDHGVETDLVILDKGLLAPWRIWHFWRNWLLALHFAWQRLFAFRGSAGRMNDEWMLDINIMWFVSTIAEASVKLPLATDAFRLQYWAVILETFGNCQENMPLASANRWILEKVPVAVGTMSFSSCNHQILLFPAWIQLYSM